MIAMMVAMCKRNFPLNPELKDQNAVIRKQKPTAIIIIIITITEVGRPIAAIQIKRIRIDKNSNNENGNGGNSITNSIELAIRYSITDKI